MSAPHSPTPAPMHLRCPRRPRLLAFLPLLLAALLGCGSEAGGPTTNETWGTGGGGAGVSTSNGGNRPGHDVGSKAGGHDDEQRSEPADRNGLVSQTDCESGAATVSFYMSSDDSNSMASPVIARELLRAGIAPIPEQIRTYEFLNYYNAHYEAPPAGTLGVHVELQNTALSSTVPQARYRLQVGVQAPAVPRVPLVLTFVVDASGSLIGQGIERERAVLLALAKQLQPGDTVNVVTWANENNVLLESYKAAGTEADKAKLTSVVSSLVPGGGSDLHAGLVKGYELAAKHFDPEKLNRVVLLSDGGANLGVVDRDLIAQAAEDADAQGIYLVGIGVGPANGYSDTLMDLVTDAGRGAYVYIDGPDEAEAVFTGRFDEVMNVAARDVRIRVDLPEYMEIENFYGEEYSTDPDTIEPQHLAPGDSMVLNQTLFVAKDVGTMCTLDQVTVSVTWQTPITREPRQAPLFEASLGELLQDPSPQALKASAVIAYAEALKTGGAAELAAAHAAATAGAKADPDLAEIAELIALHPAHEE